MDVDEIIKLSLHPDDFVVIKAPSDRWVELRQTLQALHFPYALPVLFLQPDEDIHRLPKDRAKQIMEEIKYHFGDSSDP